MTAHVVLQRRRSMDVRMRAEGGKLALAASGGACAHQGHARATDGLGCVGVVPTMVYTGV